MDARLLPRPETRAVAMPMAGAQADRRSPWPDRRRNPGWGLGRRRLRLLMSGQVRPDARRG
ncbi:MAG: hypothetical protein ACRDRO_25020 [Pseudonocardiaceae bacterium]